MARNSAPTFVSLNPCTDAILVEVAAPEQILALSHYSRDPSASSMDVEVARSFGVTGGTAEEVFALEPEVVLASTFIQPATKAALEGLGLEVEAFGIASDPQASFAQIERIAALAGQPERGRALIERIELTLKEAAAEIDQAPVRALLWQPGQIVPGEGTLIADLMQNAGLDNEAQRRGLTQADYVSLEEIALNPPEVLLVAGDSAGQSHPVLKQFPQMRAEAFDTNMLYCGGPTIIRAVERLREVRQSAHISRLP